MNNIQTGHVTCHKEEIQLWRSFGEAEAIISQVRLFNMHPTGAMNKRERLAAITGPGGIQDCANAQNCVHACPKNIPLTESIAAVNRDAWKQRLLGWLG